MRRKGLLDGMMTASGNEAAGRVKFNSKTLSLKLQKNCNYVNRNEGGKFGKVIESV